MFLSLSFRFHSFNVNISISVLQQNVFIMPINSIDLSVISDYIVIFNKHYYIQLVNLIIMMLISFSKPVKV